MNATPRLPDRKQIIWPVLGVLVATLAAINPSYRPRVPLELGIAAWIADMAIVLVFSAHPGTARLGAVIAGVFLAVPCFLQGTPLSRGLLMCCMAFPLAVAALPLVGRPDAGFRARLNYLFTWLGTRELQRRPRGFGMASLLHLIAAAGAFALALAGVKAVSADGLWLLARWLAGGIMVMAFAEMLTAGHEFITALLGVSAPALMQSPFLSRSLGEFWTKRWNPAASALLFRTFFFAPLARREAVLGLWAAFLASAVVHVLLPQMATGRWGISLMCGAFFMVQPLLIGAERWMNVRRWRQAPARAWTLAGLTITSPLFVEPALQLAEPSWGARNEWLAPTLAMLGFSLGMNAFCALGALAGAQDTVPESREAKGRSATVTVN